MRVGGVRKAIGQQIEKLAELVRPHGAKAAGQVFHLVPGHPAGQPVVEAIGKSAAHAGLRALLARADHHVVALVQLIQQAWNVGGVMLPVGIHKHQHFPLRRPRTGLDGCAIAFAVGVVYHARARCLGHGGGVVGGAVVDHQHLGISL